MSHQRGCCARILDSKEAGFNKGVSVVTISEPEIAFIGVMLVSFAVLLIVLVGSIISPFGLIRVQEERTRLLWMVDAKLDLLLRHAGIDFDPYKKAPSQVLDALQRGEKIRAIKNYMKATGVGLKEAKDFIEEFQRRSELSQD
jgi:hypothetical protein